MGIPSYFSQIVKSCPAMVKNLRQHKTTFNHLYMDCNSIIYDAVRKIDTNHADFEDKLISEVIVNINSHIELIKPSDTVFIAFDGVAPFAKMNQQRTRRYKSDFMANLDFIEPVKTKEWSTSNITPGTFFMNNLSSRLSRAFLNKKSDYKIIFSGSDEIGEGEHKIFKHIREISNTNQNVIVYGLDSDLIMLSIFHSHLFKDIYVFREAPEFIKSAVSVSDANANEIYLLDITLLQNSILNEMDCKFKDKQRVFDYVFMCFLLGNDFLPHFPALNIRTHGITTLLQTYQKMMGNYEGRYLVSKDNKIQWRNFGIFIKELAKHESTFIANEYATRNKFDKRHWKTESKADREQILLNMPTIHRVEEKYICPDVAHWEERYYLSLFGMERNVENKRKICTNYLEAIEWVFLYYSGNCPDWRWSYEYHYPPLLTDLYNHIPDFDTKFIKQNRKPFPANVQLAYVLPPAQYNLLSENMRSYITNKHPELLNATVEFQWAFCRYFWEAHLKSSHVNLSVLETWEKANICVE